MGGACCSSRTPLHRPFLVRVHRRRHFVPYLHSATRWCAGGAWRTYTPWSLSCIPRPDGALVVHGNSGFQGSSVVFPCFFAQALVLPTFHPRPSSRSSAVG